MEEDVVDLIAIPKERVAVLIGASGSVRKKIERLCGVKLEIDSDGGEVSVIRKTSGDLLSAFRAHDIIKAIARGFAPQKAFKLTDPNIYLELIDLTEFVKDKNLPRVKSRLIGKDGKARKYISALTKTEISIYGKTVGIIGDVEAVGFAKEAVTKLIDGKSHATVFRFVERNKVS